MPLSSAPLRENLSDLPPFRLHVEPRILHFRKPATTSRGTLISRTVYYIHAQAIQSNHVVSKGTGEYCIMPGLSKDDAPDGENRLRHACQEITALQALPEHYMANAPAMRFGLESALLSMKAGCANLWDTPFTRGETAIAIHHLVWMGSLKAMHEHLLKGAATGATCLKCKIAAHPFPEEIQILRDIHTLFPHTEIRVDANGAFCPREAPAKLEALAEAGVSSIEQPIKPKQWAAMATLIRNTPLPIALDEELIFPSTREERERLLDTLMPSALVIKPSLHGGLIAAEEWVSLAKERQINWWCNSALESHVGHSILTQWSALRAPGTLHGLGTGQLFADDSPPNIRLQNHHLYWQSCPNCAI